jgi:hypothetical protein
MTEYHSNFIEAVKYKDNKGAHKAIMVELGKQIVNNRADFCTLLNSADVAVNESMNDVDLVNIYVENAMSPKVIIGTAFLVNMHNKIRTVNGDEEISDAGVKSAYKAINEYWGIYETDDMFSGADAYSEIFGSKVVKGLLSKDSDGEGGGGAVGGILNKALEYQNKRKFGTLDAYKEQQQAKTQLAQSVIAQRQSQIDAQAKAKADKAKTIKIALIIGASLIVLAGGIFAYIKLKKK